MPGHIHDDVDWLCVEKQPHDWVYRRILTGIPLYLIPGHSTSFISAGFPICHICHIDPHGHPSDGHPKHGVQLLKNVTCLARFMPQRRDMRLPLSIGRSPIMIHLQASMISD